MKNVNMIKKGIATALLATMTVTGVGAYSADASVEANAGNTVVGGQKQEYGEKLREFDEEGKNKWNEEFETGYRNGITHGIIYKEHLADGIPKDTVEKWLENQTKESTRERKDAFISGYTKGILEKIMQIYN